METFNAKFKDFVPGVPGPPGPHVVSVRKVGENVEQATYMMTFSDGKKFDFVVKHGRPGAPGAPGPHVVSVKQIGQNAYMTGYRMTFSNGSYFDFNAYTGPKGETGKSAFAYAVEGGYTGTEDDFKTKLATEYATPEDVENAIKGITAGTDSFITAEGSGTEETTYTPNFTNLFDPTSSDTLVGYRTDSSGEVVEDTITPTSFVGNFIPLVQGHVIYIKNVKAQLNTHLRFQGYNASKVKVGSGFYLEKTTGVSSPCANDVSYYTDELGESVLRWEAFKVFAGSDYGYGSQIAYVRLTGVPTATMDDIIVTVDEEISYTVETGEGTTYTLDERVVVPGVVKNAEKIASMQSGAVCYVLGDSIPEGYYSTDEPSVVNGEERDYTSYYPNTSVKAWPQHMADVCGYTLVNHAIGGTGYVRGESNFRAVADTIDFSECDLAIIHGGINDFKYTGNTLGSMDNDIETGGTVVSNLRYIIQKISRDNPYCKIVVVSPINYRGLGTYETNFSIGYSNDNAYASFANLATMCDALKEACEYHGVQFIDATHCSIVNRENIKALLPDYAHPTPEGHRVLGLEMAARIHLK